MSDKASAVLLIGCPDQKGLVAAIADFLYQHNANILHADQHQDADLDLFLMRVEWDLSGFDLENRVLLYTNKRWCLIELGRMK